MLSSLELARRSGDMHHQSYALGNLTGIFIQLGKLEEANAYNEEDLALNQRLEYPLGMANALWDKARISFFAGKLPGDYE